jgi:hypothetical protein
LYADFDFSRGKTGYAAQAGVAKRNRFEQKFGASKSQEVSEMKLKRRLIVTERMISSLRSRHGSTKDTDLTVPRNDESGAILILALVYIIVVSVIVLAMSSWATNDLKNTTAFANVNSANYSATSATDVAIQSIRYNPIPSSTPTGGAATPFSECWVPTSGSISQMTVDNVNIEEWCSTTENLASPQTRVVTLEACIGTGASSVCGNPWLVAVVAYNDYPLAGALALTTQCNLMPQNTCGEGITIKSWTWS